MLLRSLTGLLARWLPSRRWYAGKGRPPGGLTLLSATELLPCTAGPQPGLLHLLVRVGPPGPRSTIRSTGSADRVNPTHPADPARHVPSHRTASSAFRDTSPYIQR
ncbi:maltokinase N-terminal cap-like domain-containing protein, partial [Streptomyces calidiresistens]|uniref:maltokinase N-terminal cap-like domain-containing protein n=1 Tax=Streptomyces calidiresistens TaxID=1485586 RepID=UPI003F68F3FB